MNPDPHVSEDGITFLPLKERYFRMNIHQNRPGPYGTGFGGPIATQMDLYLALWVNGCIQLINGGSGFITPIKM